MLKQRHQLFVALFAALDALVITGACYAAWGFRRGAAHQGFPESWETWVKEPLVLVALPSVLGAMLLLGLYRPRRDRSIGAEIGQLMKASLLGLCGMVVILWALGDAALGLTRTTNAERLGLLADPARMQLALLAALLPTGLIGHRVALRLMLRELRRRGRNLRHVAIIGVGRLGQIACRTLSRNSWTGINVAYFVSHAKKRDREQCLGRPVRGGIDDLEHVLDAHKVDAVYLALPHAEWPALPDILRRLERFALDVRIIPDVPLRYLPQNMVVSELEGMPVLSYRESPLYGVGGVTKRVLDVLGASAALLLFAPVMVLIALLVRLGGPGPVIFKQRRVGLGGEQFMLYKFRTMRHVEDEAGIDPATLDDARAAWTRRGDPRITPVGRVLRRLSLDELPQLLNVLKGEMSLVGPRPERPELIDRFKEDWRGYMLRQHVKAGMTGWAQVNGLRGDSDLKKRIQHDLFYVRHWSLRFDLWILWLTLFRGFFNRNAI
ncbi:MAG: undecaprenyl-phosphate glucose phosphotransferase [Phycisphaeraceae bacterium]|nr:undecaprenyl-phosphate glucose phosphotransferase [Phycisphaeraceae bacterium]MCW5754961.1 undecaprenyl-phosphate glucose phosphotransferase [Phycisphaeraceae bacterium]